MFHTYKFPDMELPLISQDQFAPDPPDTSTYQLLPLEYLGLGATVPIASLVDNQLVPQPDAVSSMPSAPPSEASTLIVKSPSSESLFQLEEPQRRSGKGRKKKVPKKNVKERVVKAEEIIGHKGNEDIDHLLAFVEGEEQKKDLKGKKRAKGVKRRNNEGAKRRNSVSATVPSSPTREDHTPIVLTPEPEKVMATTPAASPPDQEPSAPLTLATNNCLSFEREQVNAEVPLPSPPKRAGDSILPAVNKATSPERNAGGGKTDKKQAARAMVKPSKSGSPTVTTTHSDTIPAALESKQRKQSLTEKNKPATGSFPRRKESDEPFVLVQCKRNRDTKKPTPPGKENSDRPPMEPKFKENVYQKPRKSEWWRSPGLPPPGLEDPKFVSEKDSVGSRKGKDSAARTSPAFISATPPAPTASIPAKLLPPSTAATVSPTTQSQIARSYASSVASVVTVVTTFKKDVDFPALSPPPSPQVSQTIPVNSPLSHGTPEMPKMQDKITDNSIKNDQENGASKTLEFPSKPSHEKPVVFYGEKFESSHLSAGQKIGVDFGLGKIAGSDNVTRLPVSSKVSRVPKEPACSQAPPKSPVDKSRKEAPPKIDITKMFIPPTEKITVPESLNQAAAYMNTYASQLKKLCEEGKLSCHRVS